jgi:hypothetical protein
MREVFSNAATPCACAHLSGGIPKKHSTQRIPLTRKITMEPCLWYTQCQLYPLVPNYLEMRGEYEH